MYEIVVESEFSGAHRLVQYQGNCERIHGHNWKVRVMVRGPEVDNQGLLLDYRILRKEIEAVLKEIDHSLLNNHRDFADKNPTSENLAKWIFDRLEKRLVSDTYFLAAVEVLETDSTMARYYKQ